MADFENILVPEKSNLVQIDKALRKGGNHTSHTLHRGCDFCPAQKRWKRGIHPVMGKVRGKRLFVWAQSPGDKENRKRKELVGASGKFFWHYMEKVGLSREDCDVQNVVRCFPAEKDEFGYWQSREPLPEEVRCCSLYNDEALRKSKANVYLILGQVAARQLLGKEFRKDKKIFWSDKLGAKVICVDHPSYFLRGAPKHRLKEFIAGLKAAADAMKEETGGTPKGLERYSILFQQKIVPIFSERHGLKIEKKILKYAKKVRVANDIEDDTINDKRVLLVSGFCYKPGLAYVYVLDHPENPQPKSVRNKLKTIVARILANKKIRKIYHHGSYDVPQSEAILSEYLDRLRGYDFDTNYSTYFDNPAGRSFSLEELALRVIPKFAGYKEIIMPEAAPEGMTYEMAKKKGMLRMSKVPLKKLIAYNGGDNIVTKILEIKTKKAAPLPLMHVFMNAAFTIDKMEKNGPKFDFKYCEILEKIYPIRWKNRKRRIQKLVGIKDFNPNSHPQLWNLFYKKLRFPYLNCGEDEKPNTQADTLDMLWEETHHPVIKLTKEFKDAYTKASRYIKGFKRSALVHEGRLRTKWWLTGTITSRLRSGGAGTQKKEDGIVNLQNIHGDELIQCLIISDKRYPLLYDRWLGKFGFKDWKKEHSIAKYIWSDEEKDKRKKAQDLWLKEVGLEILNKWVEQFLGMRILMALDYSQIEVRVMAQMSEDPELIKAFEDGVDIHCFVGSELTHQSVEKIKNNAKVRRVIKAIHFALMYGDKPPGIHRKLLADGVKITLAEVEDFYNGYFRRFKKVRQLIEYFHEMAEDNGFVTTMFGFKRPIDKKDEDRETFWANQAQNSPIQGTAHQLLTIALALLHRKRNKKIYDKLEDLEMEIHDSLDFAEVLGDLPEAFGQASLLMENDVLDVVREEFGIKWKVPLIAEAKAGFRFGTMVDYTKEKSLGELVNDWCIRNYSIERKLRKELNAA